MAARSTQDKSIATVGALLHWSYANLASVDAAEKRGLPKRDRLSWMIRAKLFKGLRNGTMNVGTLFADVLAASSDRCIYCGTMPPPKLHGDHLIPRYRGGPESGDNLVWACRSCNCSKNARDLLEWYEWKDEFPPVALMRRYLKLALAEAQSLEIMDVALAAKPTVSFSLDHVPSAYPEPGETRGIKKQEL